MTLSHLTSNLFATFCNTIFATMMIASWICAAMTMGSLSTPPAIDSYGNAMPLMNTLGYGSCGVSIVILTVLVWEFITQLDIPLHQSLDKTYSKLPATMIIFFIIGLPIAPMIEMIKYFL